MAGVVNLVRGHHQPERLRRSLSSKVPRLMSLASYIA